jgi:hypothetical protein
VSTLTPGSSPRAGSEWIGKGRSRAEFLFDFEQPIVFGNALAAAERAGLYLSTAHRGGDLIVVPRFSGISAPQIQDCSNSVIA